jgi:flagellar biosynthesis protein FlhF
MKIKKIKAGTFSEALEIVKKEMGDDSVILSSSQIKEGDNICVEVVAAIEYEESITKKSFNMDFMKKEGNLKKDGISLKEDNVLNDFYDLKSEVKRLRNAIEEMKSRGCGISMPSEKIEIFHFLKERSIFEEFAFRICEKAKDIEEIPKLILSDLSDFRKPDIDKRIIMLIGTTGVGKTTTIAKLSARAIREGKRIAVISLDTYRIGAIEQMRIYTKILGVPFEIVSDSRALKGILDKYSDKDNIFIDTTGRNPFDEAYINNLRLICQSEDSIQTHLLISLNSSNDFLLESFKYYNKIPFDCIAFTKADEAIRFGTIYNMSILYKRPVAYITVGQSVPDDIEFLTTEELSNLALRCGRFKKNTKMEEVYDSRTIS